MLSEDNILVTTPNDHQPGWRNLYPGTFPNFVRERFCGAVPDTLGNPSSGGPGLCGFLGDISPRKLSSVSVIPKEYGNVIEIAIREYF
jgi:hypothetical protein